MKTSKTALAALLAATVGIGALVPVAYAQQSANQATVEPARFMSHMQDGPMGMMHDGGGFGLVGLVCSADGAEELDVAFTRLSHRLELTADQQKLFDALRTTALTAQTSFADTCTAAMPDKSATTAPDLIDRLKARVAIDTARLEAINKVLPDLEAFYDSLTDAQKASLLPGGHGDRMIYREFRDMGPGRMERGPAPGR
ncbi:MAG: Spy/CpxP family protein refolding chaperone [Devosia sp.]